MTKEELFKKYKINESHNVWDNGIDNWMIVEVYRIMHNGELSQDDMSSLYVLEFLDKVNKHNEFFIKLRQRKPDDFGSLYLTSKRYICTMSDEILKEINK